MKDKLIKAIREVPIVDKTYSEYVEALADKFLSLRIFVLPQGTTSATWSLMKESDTKYMAYPDGRIEPIPSKTDVAEEIFAEIEEMLNMQAKIVCKTRETASDTDKPMLSFIAMLDGRIYSLRVVEEHIAELKKKYTEEGK